MLLSKIDSSNLTDEIIEKILFDMPKDDGKSADCILVFGSIKSITERVNLAVKLYENKRAPKILFSGGLGKEGKQPESILMKKKAIELGMPEEDIIIEDISNNTIENVLASMLILQREFLLPKIKRIIIVSSQAHMRRISLTLSKYMPKWIEYTYCYDENGKMSKKNWKSNEDIKQKAETEAKGTIFYAKEKYIDDVEIN